MSDEESKGSETEGALFMRRSFHPEDGDEGESRSRQTRRASLGDLDDTEAPQDLAQRFRSATHRLMQKRHQSTEALSSAPRSDDLGTIIAMPSMSRKWHSLIDDAIAQVKRRQQSVSPDSDGVHDISSVHAPPRVPASYSRSQTDLREATRPTFTRSKTDFTPATLYAASEMDSQDDKQRPPEVIHPSSIKSVPPILHTDTPAGTALRGLDLKDAKEDFQYESHACHNLSLDHSTGTLKYGDSGTGNGVFIGPRPFSESLQYYSFKLLNAGKWNMVAFGVGGANFDNKYLVGQAPGSLGYHAIQGKIYEGRGFSSKTREEYISGDTLSCIVNLKSRTVTFCKNDREMAECPIAFSYRDGLYPVISVKGAGAAIQLLDQEPWHKVDEDDEDAESYGDPGEAFLARTPHREDTVDGNRLTPGIELRDTATPSAVGLATTSFVNDNVDIERGRTSSKPTTRVQAFLSSLTPAKLVILIAVVTGIIGLIVFLGVFPASFVYLDYDKLALLQNKFTNTVDRDTTYYPGCYILGPDKKFVTFTGTAHSYTLSAGIFTRDKLPVTVTFNVVYFLRPDQLGDLHRDYDVNYKDVVQSIIESEIKNTGTPFTIEEFRLERNRLERIFFDRIKQRLDGTCCPSCCPSGCTNKTMCSVCDSSNTCQRNYHIEVRFFNMQDVSIIAAVTERYLRRLLLQVYAETEFLKQDTAVTVKETQRQVQLIKNEALELTAKASAESARINVVASANREANITSAYVSALSATYNTLNIVREDHKLSLMMIRALEDANVKGNLYRSYGYQNETIVSGAKIQGSG